MSVVHRNFYLYTIADPPRITTHPQELESIVEGKDAMFTVQATGNEPLTYKWEWKPAESKEWQLCNAQGSTLTIPKVQKSNEGSYHCVISNCAGEQTSNPANLTVSKNLELLRIVLCLIITRSTSCVFSTCSCTSYNHHPPTRIKSTSNDSCKVYHSSHWYRAPKLSVAVEAS